MIKRKKGILLVSIFESIALAILMVLFLSEIISFNLFLALAIVVGVVASTAILLVIKNTEP